MSVCERGHLQAGPRRVRPHAAVPVMMAHNSLSASGFERLDLDPNSTAPCRPSTDLDLDDFKLSIDQQLWSQLFAPLQDRPGQIGVYVFTPITPD